MLPGMTARIVKNGDYGRDRFGTKEGNGVWQTIVNNIPPHETFVEAFAGTATITRLKRAATSTIVIDSDAAVCADLHATFGDAAGLNVICGDAVAWLAKQAHKKPNTVVYCDPPYLFKVRRGGNRKRYGHEFGEEFLHGELLTVLLKLARKGVPVLISGYQSELYDRLLAQWRRVDYQTTTRGGPQIESLWCSFPEPTELHEYSVAGKDFRHRERLKRKKTRWINRLATMPALERAVLIAAIDEWRRQPSTVPAMAAERPTANGSGCGGPQSGLAL